MKQQTALFDVCNTLTKTNNTHDFIGFVVKEQPLRHCLFRFYTLISFIITTLHLHHIFKKDYPRQGIISLLKGYTVDEIEQKAKTYVEKLYEKKLFHEKIMQILHREQAHNTNIVLISASINPPIQALATKLGITTYYSSELAVRKGVYTGKLHTDLLGKKDTLFENKLHALDVEHTSFYSDNQDDVLLMKQIPNAHAIAHTPKELQAWKKNMRRYQVRIPILKNYAKKQLENPTKDDVYSINTKTAPYAYIPTFYYLISRFHLRGAVIEVFLKNILPVALFVYFFSIPNTPFMTALFLSGLSFFAFFTAYEIGGLINDIYALTKSSNNTLRIRPGTKINTGLFIFIRLVTLDIILLYFSHQGYNAALYFWLMLFCIGMYFLHTIASKPQKIVTFTTLKLCRAFIPLIIFIDLIQVQTLFFVLLINTHLESTYYYLSDKHAFARISLGKRIYLKGGLVALGVLLYLLTSNSVYFTYPVYFLGIELLSYTGKIVFEDKVA